MATQLEQLKDDIEGGESVVYAFEQIDLDKMREEGDGTTADKIQQVLDLVNDIEAEAGIEFD